MITSSIKSKAVSVRFTADMFYVGLADGREVGVPLSWFPRLAGASMNQKANWRLIGQGSGIHWEEIDEDVSVEALLEGKGSGA